MMDYGGEKIDRLREEIVRTEHRLEENLRQIGGKLSVESLSSALAAGGSEFFSEKLKPSISGLGETMKATMNRVLDSINRAPLPVLMMGAGAGLVLFSLFSGRQFQRSGREQYWEENLEESMEEGAVTGSTRSGEETGDFGKASPGPASLGSMALGLSVLALGVAMSGVIPGINSERVEELKSELFSKAFETGEEFIKGTERILKERLSP
jgi:hypothetical protein